VKRPLLNNPVYGKVLSAVRSISLKPVLLLLIILFIKILLQVILLNSGFMWLSADDFCRTVKSYEWYQNPIIYSGVWLTGHFWLNGIVMIFVKDLFTAATLVNFIFSSLTVAYFFYIIKHCFDLKTAFFSSLIFSIFHFQVWLSISGLPESIFFFFVISAFYYFLSWRSNSRKTNLVAASLLIAASNLFRYEGWLFSIVLILFVAYDYFKAGKVSKEFIINLLISLIGISTIIFWIVLNHINHKDAFFFAKETNKIYEEFSTTKYLQKIIQYPAFIFYIAPLTTILSLKVFWDIYRDIFKKGNKFSEAVKYFALFNVLELTLLMIQGMLGTGGTNMISRYIVLNALFFIPYSIYQVFLFRKSIAASLLAVVIIVNLIWCFYYPHPFREDTYETGYLLKNQIAGKTMKPDEKIYYEEVEGYYDVFAIQSLSNNPSRFVLGNFPSFKSEEKKTKKGKKQLSDEELNILDIKTFLEKNKIAIAVVKSDSYVDKLRKLKFKNEDIGDYKIFYVKDFESNISDSSYSVFSQNVSPLSENPDLINFNKLLALKDIKFGMRLTGGGVFPTGALF